MRFGVHVFPTQFSFQPDELARAAEERGLESVWFSEHTHIPLRFLNAPGRTSPLPEYYWQTYDIFVAMTLAAAATKNIKVGTGVSLIVERNPIFLAKETASETARVTATLGRSLGGLHPTSGANRRQVGDRAAGLDVGHSWRGARWRARGRSR